MELSGPGGRASSSAIAVIITTPQLTLVFLRHVLHILRIMWKAMLIKMHFLNNFSAVANLKTAE
jgi:hypothetical protein